MTMTLQQAFDTMYNGVVQQGKPSVGMAGDCLYRGSDNRKCAVGFLIPDNLYNHETMEPTTPNALYRGGVIPAVTDADEATVLAVLSGVQVAHDDAATEADFLVHFTRAAEYVANKHDLTIPH